MKMHQFRAKSHNQLECEHCGHSRRVDLPDPAPACAVFPLFAALTPEVLADWQEAA